MKLSKQDVNDRLTSISSTISGKTDTTITHIYDVILKKAYEVPSMSEIDPALYAQSISNLQLTDDMDIIDISAWFPRNERIILPQQPVVVNEKDIPRKVTYKRIIIEGDE